MKCKDCNHFCQTHIGSRGSIHGSCKLKCSASYTDTRLGRRNACKHFEVREALQTEPCEDADLISRDYVKEHLTACFENGREFHSPDLAEVLQMIDDVPSVNPTCAKMEQVEDCISRQAAIDALIGWETDPLDEEIEMVLRKLPPVQPELNCRNCVFRMGYGTGIDEGVLNVLPKKMEEGDADADRD